MKILAVSDKEHFQLQNTILKNYKKFQNIDFVVSCGDLSKKYLEFLVDGLRKELYFVEGNHPIIKQYYHKNHFDKLVAKIYDNEKRFDNGGINLHARMEIYGNYIIAGFEGSMRYNGKSFQYTEKAMEKIVKNISVKIKKQMFFDKIFKRKKKQIIIVSHAPVAGIHDKEDVCHKGFECFKKFIYEFNPLIWLHGHVHYEGQINEQISKIGNTLVVNVYGVHIIDILKDKINIVSNAKIFTDL